MNRFIALLVPAFLAGCGTLPQPFLGRPGSEGSRLSVPPPPVLIIPTPHKAMLGNAAAARYAAQLAAALVAEDVPSIARPAGKNEWVLSAGAQVSAGEIIPSFVILGPTGKVYGHATVAAVSAQSWANGDVGTLKSVSQEAAPELAHQLGTINALIQESNPESLENRPPRVLVTGIKGAPGDGDHALALGARRDLSQLGIVVVSNKHDADFILSGMVKVSPAPTPPPKKDADIVELDWVVRNQSGAFIGKVSQLHELSQSQMTPYWGDVAAAAAQQAAIGIKQVIVNATPKRDVASPGIDRRAVPAKSAKPPGP